jgi:4-amino-4-deoxy-L-arabinose transferase-like glycosyltransferase
LTTRRRFAAEAVVVLALVLALRLPFLNQAIQGDDFYYLKGAEHAQIDPLHPTHARYIFQGRLVDMRGHPHPPLNSWFLAALLAITGDEREIPYHAAYLVWSIAAALGMLWLARRFVPDRALAAAVLFCVTLPFVVNGTSLEADLPLLGCWMLSTATLVAAVDRRSPALALAAAILGGLAGLAAYQAIVLVPILGVYLWQRDRRWLPGWAALAGVPAAILGYQVFERVSGGSVPASVLAGYMQSERLQQLSSKVRNAVALTGHLGWIVFPVLALLTFRPGRRTWFGVPLVCAFGAAVYDPNPLFWISIAAGSLVVMESCRRLAKSNPDEVFLAAWILIFFAAALVLFFAGSARYLLPLSAPVVILACRRLSARWLYAGAAANAVIAVGLAAVNYQHWDVYRQFASTLANESSNRRVWVNGEWGLRHYIEAAGGLPLARDQAMRSGDIVVQSSYAPPLEAPQATIATRVITSPIPLRIVALGARSGYSSIAFGMRPFDVSLAPMDVVRAGAIDERRAVLSRVTIGTPDAAECIVSGVTNADRWMSGRAVLILKRPADATRVQAQIYIPPQSPARTFTFSINGLEVARESFAGPGTYRMSAPAPQGDPATIVMTADKTFSAPPDTRALSALMLQIGFE